MSKIPANFDILKKYIIVKSINNQRIIITTNPKSGDFNVKKTSDQSMLNINCTMKSISAVLTSGVLNPCRQIRYAAMPINTKSTVQTGANTQFGGANDGFFKAAYQVGILALVNIEPINPAARHTMTLTNNLTISFIYTSSNINT
jgi:hypothetical protein